VTSSRSAAVECGSGSHHPVRRRAHYAGITSGPATPGLGDRQRVAVAGDWTGVVACAERLEPCSDISPPQSRVQVSKACLRVRIDRWAAAELTPAAPPKRQCPGV